MKKYLFCDIVIFIYIVYILGILVYFIIRDHQYDSDYGLPLNFVLSDQFEL